MSLYTNLLTFMHKAYILICLRLFGNFILLYSTKTSVTLSSNSSLLFLTPG